MKILVPLEEIKQIVSDALRARNLPIKLGSASIISRVEGQYDDAREVLEGVSFELEEPNAQVR